MNKGPLALTCFQFAYMSRPYLKVKESFLDKLFVNIGDIGFREMGETGVKLEDELLALAIRAFGARKLQDRQYLCGVALDALEVFKAPEKATEAPEAVVEEPVEKIEVPAETYIASVEVSEPEKEAEEMVVVAKKEPIVMSNFVYKPPMKIVVTRKTKPVVKVNKVKALRVFKRTNHEEGNG